MTEQRETDSSGDEALVWSVIATLVAGPAVWGAVGLGVDTLVGTSRVFTAVGVVLGFVTSFYIVYVKFGSDARDSGPPPSSTGDAR